ncbi:hypothetical protein ACFVH4_15370 [Nocardia ignorata]|uniref:hypothetical protein n=1 Tax=Nocardia ignorata TaxID=145285 RepID=UPI00363BA17D
MAAHADPNDIAVQSLFTGKVANLLRRAGIDSAAQLLCYSPSDLFRIAHVGALTLAQINAGLAEHDLALIADPTPQAGPTVVEQHRALLARHRQAVSVLEGVLADPSISPTVRAEVTEVVSALRIPLTTEQQKLLDQLTAAVPPRRRRSEH